MNCKLNLSYDGTAYHGWQRQNNAMTVCEIVEKAIEDIFGQFCEVTGCSRTDAGVHAINYVCNFDAPFMIPADKLHLALNTKLPDDVRVKSGEYVDDDFHSRFSAKSKTYVYRAYCGEVLDPFLRNYACHFPFKVDIDKIKAITKHFEGKHDFAGFMAQGSSQKTTVRTVNFLRAHKNGDIIEFEINADAYLYNMVRIIAGTLLYVGCGKIDGAEIPYIIKSCDRTRGGITAEPQGLYLKEVIYE